MYIDAGQFYWGTKKLWKKRKQCFYKKNQIYYCYLAQNQLILIIKKIGERPDLMQKKNDPLINTLTSKLIFIGGVTRSGKSFLCPIVSTFKKTGNVYL